MANIARLPRFPRFPGFRRGLILSVLIVGTLAGLALANDWPQYRGPDRNGASTEKGMSITWPAAGPKKLWETNVGNGGSSVVTRAGKLYTMGNLKDTDTLYCFDAKTGQEIWRFERPEKLDTRSFEGGTAGTPAVDDSHVYVLTHTGYLVCLDLKGAKVWDVNVIKDFGGEPAQWKYAGSPLIEGNLLIVDIGGDNSTLALDKNTGKKVWSSGKAAVGYASPVALDFGGKRIIVLFKLKRVVAVDAADGRQLWDIPWPTQTANAPTPVFFDKDKLFIGCGYPEGACGVIQLTEGTPKTLWQNKSLKGHAATAVYRDGYLYGYHGQLRSAIFARLKCVDAASGEEKWAQQKDADGKDLGTGALTLVDDKLVALFGEGRVADCRGNAHRVQRVGQGPGA